MNEKTRRIFNWTVTIAMVLLTGYGSFKNGWLSLANLVSWLGLLGTIGLAYAKQWNFPFNMAQNLFAAVQGGVSRLYGDMFMSIFYFLSQIYGIYNWKNHKTESGELKIVKQSNWPVIIGAVVIGGFVLGLVSYLMGGEYIFLDAFNNATAIVAQVLQMRRNRGGWILWIITNVIGVYIWFGVGQPQMAIMYLVFTLNALRGLVNWNAGATDEEGIAL
ncbi:MAG: nicotinamide riboside transporter PnuC [Aerococcus sp.]|nr:nicotinamide riboside transporter PnuC [Aerococcus sp.]